MIFVKELPKKRGIYYVRKTVQSKIYMAYMYKKHGLWWAEVGPDCLFAFTPNMKQFTDDEETMLFRSEESVTI